MNYEFLSSIKGYFLHFIMIIIVSLCINLSVDAQTVIQVRASKAYTTIITAYKNLQATLTGNESNIRDGKYSSAVWITFNQFDEVNHQLNGKVSGFSKFTGGLQSATHVESASLNSFVNFRNLYLQ